MGKKYIYVKPASAEDKTFADFFAQEQYDDAIIDGIWTQEDAEEYLEQMGYWLPEYDEEIEKINENMENMKLDYYNHFYNKSTRKYIKSNLDKLKEKVNDLSNKRYLFYDKTCEYIKSYAKSTYLLQKNSYIYNGNLASDIVPMQILYNKQNNFFSEMSTKLRKISRSNEWRMKWSSLKHEIFENSPSSLIELQLSLISWSSYYDSVYQSYDKPSEEIIEDDIALDGWAISERRKRKEEEKQKNAEKMLPKNMKNAGEIFIPARNTQEASDIMSLNNAQGKAKVRSLQNDIKHYGRIDDADLSDNVMTKQMQSIQMQKEKRRQ